MDNCKKCTDGDILELLENAKNGCEESFNKIYSRFFSPVFRYIFFNLGLFEDSQDLAQEVFLRAWKKLEQLEIRSEKAFSNWLYKIAHNLIVDFSRKKKLKRYLPEALENFDFVPNGKSLEERIGDRGTIEKLWRLLDILSHEQREILILRFLNGFSNKEIAHLLNKSVEAVRVAQSRALKKLREELDK